MPKIFEKAMTSKSVNSLLWEALNPQETIEEHKPLQATSVYSLSPLELADQIESLKRDGYCYIPSLIDSEKTERMLASVHLMVKNGFPPVYCFVYDLFWQLILDLDPLLRLFLKGEYSIIPNAWAWVVDGNKTTAYFPPHRDLIDEDFIDEEGMPTLFSLWIPLTDVSTHHSCMYLLPASKDPEYPHAVSGWRQKGALRSWRAEELVHIRALPAPKGSIMGWNAGVFHWGSEPHPKASERVSIGYYFHAPHAKKKYSGLVDLKKPLSFERRMGVIFESLRLYGKSLKS